LKIADAEQTSVVSDVYAILDEEAAKFEA